MEELIKFIEQKKEKLIERQEKLWDPYDELEIQIHAWDSGKLEAYNEICAFIDTLINRTATEDIGHDKN